MNSKAKACAAGPCNNIIISGSRVQRKYLQTKMKRNEELFHFRSVFYFFITCHQLFIIPDLFPIFFGHVQHAETFAIMTIQVFMMHFMRPANSPYISVIAPGKPFEALMNDHIMHQEISKPVRHDPKADRLHPPYTIKRTK